MCASLLLVDLGLGVVLDHITGGYSDDGYSPFTRRTVAYKLSYSL